MRVRADLDGLHAGFCFGPSFKNSVVDNGSRGRRLSIHDPALLRRRVANYVRITALLALRASCLKDLMRRQLTIEPVLLFGECEPSLLHSLETIFRRQIFRFISEFTAIARVLSVLFRFDQHDVHSVRLLPSLTHSEPSFRLIEQRKRPAKLPAFLT